MSEQRLEVHPVHVPGATEAQARARMAEAERGHAVGRVRRSGGAGNANMDDPVRDDLRWQYAGAQEQWDIITQKGR